MTADFGPEKWNDGSVFDFMKQSYLLTSRYLEEAVGTVQGLDDKRAHQLRFYSRQYVDAMSPSNFAMTNPDVLDKTMETGGQNLVKGYWQSNVGP